MKLKSAGRATKRARRLSVPRASMATALRMQMASTFQTIRLRRRTLPGPKLRMPWRRVSQTMSRARLEVSKS